MTKIARSLILFATCLTGSVLAACSGGDPFPTPLPTATPFVFPTPLPTATPFVFPTPLPTATPFVFPTPLPTATAVVFPTALPSSTALPTPTPFVVVFPTPLPTSTPAPTSTPLPDLLLTPSTVSLTDLAPTEESREPFAECSGSALDNRVVALEVPLPNGDANIGVGWKTGAREWFSQQLSNVIVTTRHLFDGQRDGGLFAENFAHLVYPDVASLDRGDTLQFHPFFSNSPLDMMALEIPDADAQTDEFVDSLADVYRWRRPGIPFVAEKKRGNEVMVLGVAKIQPPDTREPHWYQQTVASHWYQQTVARGNISNVDPSRSTFRLYAPAYKGLSGAVVFDSDCHFVGMVIEQDEKTGELIALTRSVFFSWLRI